jgi:hypothetical protein
MVDPHDPDRQEADRVGDVRRPEIEQFVAQVALGDRLFDAYGKDQRVIAIAKTPSLNASTRPVSMDGSYLAR